MDKSKLMRELKIDEGTVLHEYKDSLGYSTIGHGRLIDKRKGGGITLAEAEYLLKNDIDRVWNEVQASFPWVTDQPEKVQQALCMMAFQMGIKKVQGFSTTIKNIKLCNYAAAADSAMQSLWARQTPNRAKKVTDLIRSANKI